MIKKLISLSLLLLTFICLEAQDHYSKSFREEVGLHNPAFLGMYENFNINGLYSTIYPNNLSVKPIIKLSLNLPIEKINSSIGIHFDNYYTIGFEIRSNFGVK